MRYGGHTSCLAVTHADADTPALILDCGTGVRGVTRVLGDGPFRGSILLTHLHWDHVLGLPFFAAADREGASTTLLLPAQEDESSATAALAGAMSPPHFPIGPEDLRGSWTFDTLPEGEWQGEGFTVHAREVPHKGGRTFGYRVSDGRSTFTYIPDHGPTLYGAGPDGWGEYHPAAMDLCEGADLLVHDAQLLNDAELAREASFGHACADYALALARRARVARVVLFHHRFDRTDAALDELARLHEPDAEVQVAVQGSTLEL
jgi:ribonuclease BN (tRNA processing enzyme)